MAPGVDGGEKPAEPLPPEPRRFVADINAPLLQQILDIPTR